MRIQQSAMNPFTVELERRDFSGPVNLDCVIQPVTLGWSAFGGPEKAELVVRGAEENLVGPDRAAALRSHGAGYARRSGLVGLCGRGTGQAGRRGGSRGDERPGEPGQCPLRPTFQPGGLPGETGITPTARNSQSEREYGIQELVLQREDIDEVFAESLRDTWLVQHAWPVSTLSRRSQSGAPEVRLVCAGWFKTLAWRHYAHEEGFYANTGPRAGFIRFWE